MRRIKWTILDYFYGIIWDKGSPVLVKRKSRALENLPKKKVKEFVGFTLSNKSLQRMLNRVLTSLCYVSKSMASVFVAMKVHEELCDIIETSIKKQRVINQKTYLFSMRNWYSSLTSNPCQDQFLHTRVYMSLKYPKIIIISLTSNQ